MIWTIVFVYLCVHIIIFCAASVIDHSQSSLTSIPTSIPNDCTSLNLSNNMLSYIPADSLDHLAELVELDISYNTIVDIEDKFLQSNPRLVTLICDSCFDCSCFKKNLDTWLDWITTTAIGTTRLSCLDGRKIDGLSRTLCTGKTNLHNTFKEPSTEGVICVVLAVVLGSVASIVIVVVMVRMSTRPDDVTAGQGETQQDDGRGIEERNDVKDGYFEMSTLGERDKEIVDVEKSTTHDISGDDSKNQKTVAELYAEV